MFISKNITKQPRLWSGFTLIELLVVIVIIGILATLTTVSLTSARGKARDARRISDLKQIATALELYQADNNSYPALITGGNSLASPDGSKIYMKKIPNNPSPQTEGACGAMDYQYAVLGNSFNLVGCLAKGSGEVTAGYVKLSAGNFSSIGPVDGVISGAVRSPGILTGLVGWWTFDDTNGATDLSGYGSNGTIVGTGLVADRYGRANSARSFSGVLPNYISIAPTNKSILQPSQISISAWAYETNSPNSYLIMHGQPVNNDKSGYALTNRRLVLVLVNGSATQSPDGNASVPLNDWYMITGTYDGAVLRTYINGLEVGTGTVMAGNIIYNVSTGINNFEIGRFAYAIGIATPSIDGLSDLRIYNRALSASEVQQLWEMTK